MHQLQEMNEQAQTPLNKKQLRQEAYNQNVCSISQKHIIIQYNGCKFCVFREVNNIDEVRFSQMDQSGMIDQANKIIEQFSFVCVYGMLQLQNTPVLIFVLSSRQAGNINKNIVYQAQAFKVVKVRQIEQQPFLSSLQRSFQLLKLYYCQQYDLSKNLQIQLNEANYSYQQYFSNSIHTINHESYPSELLTIFITGFVKTQYLQLDDKTVRMTLVSRGDYRRLGRRWLRRGLDNAGNTANQYESEIIIEVVSSQKHQIYSYVQQRGSIPIFWEQFPCFEFKATLKISQNEMRNQKYMNRYLTSLIKRYKSVVLLNLVNKDGRQGEIGNAFQQYFNRIKPKNSKFIWFDYGGQYSRKKRKAFEELIDELRVDLTGNYLSIQTEKGRDFMIKSQQTRVIRTNCMDCLDRTNYAQSLICKIICIQLQQLIVRKQKNDIHDFTFQLEQFEAKFKALWKENGITISKQYSGTSTMKNDFLDKGERTVGGMFDDFCIGLHRFYLGHFKDYYNQNCIDLHYGKIDFVEDSAHFKGVWWKRIYKWVAFSGIFLFPILFWRKIEQHFKIKTYQYATTIGTSFAGFLLGGIVCKIANKVIVQQPISRKYEIV